MLADQGGIAFEACAFVEPSGSCLVAASPLEPPGSVGGRLRLAEGGGEQVLDLADRQRDQAGVGGRFVVGPGGRRGLAVGAFAQPGGGDGADGEGGHDQDQVPQDRGVEPGLALVEPEAALAELEAFLDRPAQARCLDQPGLGRELPFRDVAVVKGQLAGLQVPTDQQAAPRRCGADPGPGLPAVALGPLPGGADLPAVLALE